MALKFRPFLPKLRQFQVKIRGFFWWALIRNVYHSLFRQFTSQAVVPLRLQQTDAKTKSEEHPRNKKFLIYRWVGMCVFSVLQKYSLSQSILASFPPAFPTHSPNKEPQTAYANTFELVTTLNATWC